MQKPSPSKKDTPKQKGYTRPIPGMSKFPSHSNQPSTDKVGNPICFKCRKISFTKDCLKHPYKPRVYALGLAENETALEELPEEAEEIPEEPIELDSSDQDVVLADNNKDIYVNDP